jgi:pimeloyl-ACP methyl ester carboxylesterase
VLSKTTAALAAALLSAALLPATLLPAAASPARSPAPSTWRGTIVAAGPVPAQTQLAGAGRSWLVSYRSTSWSGRPTVVTGTVFLPVGKAPRGGWPVVSFAHGFNGIGDACAPSRTGPSPWERALQEALLGAGYAVAATDFEGLGTPSLSPGIHGPAEAYGIVDAVEAARRLAPVSRDWVAVGYSLGGHGALFAAALAGSYAPDLRLRGTVALAPVSQWAVQLSTPVWRDPAAAVLYTAPYSGATLPLTTRGQFRPQDWYTPLGLGYVRRALTECGVQMQADLAGVTTGQMFRDPAAAADEFTRLLAPQEVPVGAYPQPVVVAHGLDDPLEPLSELTVPQLAAAGTAITLVRVPGADHLTLLPTIAPQVTTWVGALFAGTPPVGAS